MKSRQDRRSSRTELQASCDLGLRWGCRRRCQGPRGGAPAGAQSRGGGDLVSVSVSGAQNAVWFRGLAENQNPSSTCPSAFGNLVTAVTVDRLEIGFGFRTSPKNQKKTSLAQRC